MASEPLVYLHKRKLKSTTYTILSLGIKLTNAFHFMDDLETNLYKKKVIS